MVWTDSEGIWEYDEGEGRNVKEGLNESVGGVNSNKTDNAVNFVIPTPSISLNCKFAKPTRLDFDLGDF